MQCTMPNIRLICTDSGPVGILSTLICLLFNNPEQKKCPISHGPSTMATFSRFYDTFSAKKLTACWCILFSLHFHYIFNPLPLTWYSCLSILTASTGHSAADRFNTFTVPEQLALIVTGLFPGHWFYLCLLFQTLCVKRSASILPLYNYSILQILAEDIMGHISPPLAIQLCHNLALLPCWLVSCIKENK